MCLVCSPGMAAVLGELNRRQVFKGAASLASVLAAASVARPALAEVGAEAIFVNGPIRTMGPAAAAAEAVAVANGRIVAVGTKDEVLTRRGPGTRLIDLGGRALLPGFVDPHMHTAFVGMDHWLDLSPFANASIDEAMARLRTSVASARPGDWILGRQIDPSLMPGPAITRARLDEIAPDNPVFVLESNGHIAYANSRAFDLAGVARTTADPPRGRFVRDDDGELTGRLEESAAYTRFVALAPAPSPETLSKRLGQLFDRASAVGCTSLQDCAIGSPAALAQLADALAADAPVRMRAFIMGQNPAFWSDTSLRPGGGGDRFRVNGFKFVSDGSNQARTGFQREPYLGSSDRGLANYSAKELSEQLSRAHRAGWQIAVHANGDAAIDMTIDAYEAAISGAPRLDHRHRIEHCSILHGEQMDRMASLGVSPSFLIGHVHYWGRAFQDRVLGPERAALYDPCASALQRQLRISLHSDYTVTPLGPLRCVDNAVNRTMREGGGVLNPAERITVDQALRAVTIDAAWQCQMDHIVGSLEPGKYADLVLLDRDPYSVDPAEIGAIKVSETWFEGRRRHTA
jgi:predicted amidohydrolase YtcJ